MNAILKILVFLSMTIGIFGQENVERMLPSNEMVDDTTSIDEPCISYKAQDFISISISKFDMDVSASDKTAIGLELSYKKELYEYLEYNINIIGIGPTPKEYQPWTENVNYAVFAMGSIKLKPIVTDYVNVYMGCEAGVSMTSYCYPNIFSGDFNNTEYDALVGTTIGAEIKLNSEMKLHAEYGSFFQVLRYDSPIFQKNPSKITVGISMNLSQF